MDVPAQHDRAAPEQTPEERSPARGVLGLSEQKPVRRPGIGSRDGRVQHEERVAGVLARIQHRIELRRVRAHEVQEEERIRPLAEHEVRARHRPPDRLGRDRQDVGVERLAAAAADVVVAAHGEERKAAEALRAGRLRIPEETQIRIEVGAVALDEVAHLEEIGGVGAACLGRGRDKARKTRLPHRDIALELVLAADPVPLVARHPFAVIEALRRGVEVGIPQNGDGVRGVARAARTAASFRNRRRAIRSEMSLPLIVLLLSCTSCSRRRRGRCRRRHRPFQRECPLDPQRREKATCTSGGKPPPTRPSTSRRRPSIA